ncbi:dipeptidyl peptidase IV N-terminal region-domain-containing protein [Dichotomopilus funicola]|uniref:Probable dipeptidyl-aminopeptidase B n=1 Tax=Dichotomopilus funicola TaxID=1934379 RepID=A0AAN6V548_9PEZI|nr:dipeptidyl peptidase IV N-terminal region-domain-containing protein [Dichotomopilus funicola]
MAPPYRDDPFGSPNPNDNDEVSRDRRTRSQSRSRMSHESGSSVSTTSIVFDRIGERVAAEKAAAYEKQQRRSRGDNDDDEDDDDDEELKDELNTDDLETGPFLGNNTGSSAQHAANKKKNKNGAGGKGKGMDRGMRRVLLITAGLLVAAWVAGLVVYVASKSYKPASATAHDPQATVVRGSGKAVTLDQVMGSFWHPEVHSIRWIAGPNGEDGLLVEKDAGEKGYLVVEDVRSQNVESANAAGVQVAESRVLMKKGDFAYGEKNYNVQTTALSRDLQRVLLGTNVESNWRHSTYATYWIFDVESQTAEPLVPGEPEARIQLAQWNPAGDGVAFTRDNNLFLRKAGSDQVIQITKDGGSEVFNGVPDWVYEEEVFSGSSATWWSEDSNYIAFLRTNETGVPEYPVQYFLSRPSGTQAVDGEESYPEVRNIKYPKAGAHNPVVELKFYDVTRGDVFSVDISGGFADDDRLITEVVWAGSQVLVKETNRVSDVMRVVLVDVAARAGKTVRTTDVKAIDGGWFEITHQTKHIPADPAKSREHDGYIDLIIHGDGNHLAYFTPLDNPDPVMLTSGDWEVVDSPYSVDLDQNVVYFVATKESSIQRHVYQVKLTGEDLAPVSDVSSEGYYASSFSNGGGYALLSYQGPGIPWQKVISTPSNPHKYEHTVEENQALAENAKKHELPLQTYGTINVDGVDLNFVERRPPHFDANKQYPVLFQQYSGPGSQTVNKRFAVDFQSFVTSGLGYICVTVDGRGTGYIGRKNRVIVRGNLGEYESHDQIAAAKIWAAKPYIDETRLAIWGWSYGGFNTLKTLERDGGETFRYGMAVAPVTDWRFYDSIYTERYMLTPQTNGHGYDTSAILNTSALAQNVRFLLMHGVADDNVHFQNSLTLLDKLDLAGVDNYDVHVFPDSDHSIYFHNAHRIVYEKLTNWLINAFNGEWLKVAHPKPNGKKRAV